MNPTSPESQTGATNAASCRVPFLALFGGGALWLVVGLTLAILASLTFHKPDIFANCAWLTYGRLQPAANDAIVYGFCVPAALGVILWIFCQLSESELLLPLLPIVGANLWHLGVFVGLIEILIGGSTGFPSLEFQRGGSVLLFAAFLLIAISAFATFGARRRRELHPSHWFLLAALFWFPWIYSTANLFLMAWPVRGVCQAVVDWWFCANFLFVWTALAGIGVGLFYLFGGPNDEEATGPDDNQRFLTLFSFWTLILFGAWCGIPQGAPVPAWLPALSAVGAALTILPILTIASVALRAVRTRGAAPCRGGPRCSILFGTAFFVISGIMFVALGCPHIGPVIELTWFAFAQTQLQILGFLTIVLCGAICALMPRVMGFDLVFPRLARVRHWLFISGIVLFAGALAVGGILQGLKLQSLAPFATVTASVLPFYRVSTTGLLFLWLGALLFALNIFGMTLKWKLARLHSCLAWLRAPEETIAAADTAAAAGNGRAK